VVGDDGGLHGVLFLLARDERAPSAASGWRPADLDLGGVQAELNALGLGIGEHVRECPQAQSRTVGDRASPLGQESTYLPDRAGDGGAVDAEQQPQHRVREVVPQVDEGSHQPVDEDQLMSGSGSRSPPPRPSPCLVTATFDTGLPRLSQLLDQARQMTPRGPREQPMRQDRPIDHDRHKRIKPPTSGNASPATTHQLVSACPGSSPAGCGTRGTAHRSTDPTPRTPCPVAASDTPPTHRVSRTPCDTLRCRSKGYEGRSTHSLPSRVRRFESCRGHSPASQEESSSDQGECRQKRAGVSLTDSRPLSLSLTIRDTPPTHSDTGFTSSSITPRDRPGPGLWYSSCRS
jgi:hypothetical protein